MIQRIQTVFLLLALVSMLLLFAFPYGNVLAESEQIISFEITGTEYPKDGEIKTYSALPLTIMIGLICFISFITILLFKKRMIQIRLSFFNMVLQLGSVGMMYFFIYQANKVFGEGFSVNVLIIIPIVAMILTFLAIRNIGKDEALVRSINRIR